MASIYKCKEGGWRAVIRIKGYPAVCETFDRKQEAFERSTQCHLLRSYTRGVMHRKSRNSVHISSLMHRKQRFSVHEEV